MKFLVDAHLPRSLCALLAAHGHDVLHTHDLPDRNETRDGVLNRLALDEQRILVSKDTDFFYSHLLQGRPWKLLLVRNREYLCPRLEGLVCAQSPAHRGSPPGAYARRNRPPRGHAARMKRTLLVTIWWIARAAAAWGRVVADDHWRHGPGGGEKSPSGKRLMARNRPPRNFHNRKALCHVMIEG